MSEHAPIFEVIDTTWPAARHEMAGGFKVRFGAGGGSRASCASLEGPLHAADIAAAGGAHRPAGQVPKFMVRPGEQALDDALHRRGYSLFDPVTIYAAPVDRIADAVPPVTAFMHWPPLQIVRDLWSELGIGPARQAVMERAAEPRSAVLGRMGDRAAGAMFAAIHGDTAMLHALVILPEMRRKGLARVMIVEAAQWAAAQGAARIALVVTQANQAANPLYRSMGFEAIGAYHYRLAPGETS